MSSEEPAAVLDAVAKRDETPVTQHVEAFHKAVTSRMDDVDGVLWSAWNHFFDIVEATAPGEQQRLVDFVVTLKGY